jgi:hypothetical protein
MKNRKTILNVFVVVFLILITTNLMAQNDRTIVQSQEMQTFCTYLEVGSDQDSDLGLPALQVWCYYFNFSLRTKYEIIDYMVTRNNNKHS